MRNRLIAVVLFATLSAPTPAQADLNNQPASNRAVSGVNGELGLDWGKINFEGGDEQTRSTIRAGGSVPLGQAFGLNLSASQSHSEQSDPDLEYDTEAYSVSAFWRNPQGGLLGYGRGRAEVTEFDAKWDTQTIVAAAYSEVAALSVLSEKAEATSGPAIDSDLLWYHIVAYPSPDSLFDLGIGAQDADKSYSLALEQQLTSVPGLSYGLTYLWLRDGSDEATQWFLTLNYRLGDRKPLVRRYHEDLYGVR